MGKEKGYNSRFTSNTETVSRVACYLYIKATRKLAAALFIVCSSLSPSTPLSTNFLFSLLLFLPIPTPSFLPLLFSIRPLHSVVFAGPAAKLPPTLGRSVSIFAPPSPLAPGPRFPHPFPGRGHLGKELFIGQVSSPVTYVGRNRATPAKTEEI